MDNLDKMADMCQQKQRWLLSHVDVAYPTPESIKGRDLYLQQEQNRTYQAKALDELSACSTYFDQIYLADFHRLTVMFAQLASKSWQDSDSQAYVLEFLAQITLDEKHGLYLGFKDNQLLACGIVTIDDSVLLLSDLFMDGQQQQVEPNLGLLYEAQLVDQISKQHAIGEVYSCF